MAAAGLAVFLAACGGTSDSTPDASTKPPLSHPDASTGTCTPSCVGKVCGSNGCGGQCGSCGSNQYCTSAGQCQAGTCTGSCTGKVCGDDGCGSSCGTCGAGQSCSSSGQCVTAAPAGSVSVVSSNNQLPPAWVVTDPAILKSDDSGAGASAHIAALVTLSAAMTVSNNPCPLPYTSSTGKTYCDGFNVSTSTGSAVVDTFSFLGTSPTCKASLPTTGSLNSVTGIWQSSYNSTTKTDTWTIALADCSGIGQGTAYAGTATPPASTDVHQLLSNFTDGQQVTVKGVVTAVWSATTAFGFSLEDPAGGPNSAISVSKGKASTTTSVAPKVGDYVSVSATTRHEGAVIMSLTL